MRDYQLMRYVLGKASPGEITYGDISETGHQEEVEVEVQRLLADGLLDGEVRRDEFSQRLQFRIHGLTDEGRAFWRLVENDRVWELVLATLRKAGVDVSYPLLKEVCEEIVKRYVTSFIPEKIS